MKSSTFGWTAAVAVLSIVACESKTDGPTDPGAAGVVAAVAPLCRGQVATIYPGAPALPAGASVTANGGGGFNIQGTDGSDVIVASAGNDSINARGGNDVICVLDGDDFVKQSDALARKAVG